MKMRCFPPSYPQAALGSVVAAGAGSSPRPRGSRRLVRHSRTRGGRCGEFVACGLNDAGDVGPTRRYLRIQVGITIDQSNTKVDTAPKMVTAAEDETASIHACLANAGTPRIRVVEPEVAHIPGALFFDLDGIVDQTTDLPHMLPSEEAFTTAISELDIKNQDKVIVYDGKGFFSAPHVWWIQKSTELDDTCIMQPSDIWKAHVGSSQSEGSGLDMERNGCNHIYCPSPFQPIASAGQHSESSAAYFSWPTSTLMHGSAEGRANYFGNLQKGVLPGHLGRLPKGQQATTLLDLMIIRAFHSKILRRFSLRTTIGFRIRKGTLTDTPAILVFVARKVHRKLLSATQCLPTALEGPGGVWCDVDVVEFSYYGAPAPTPKEQLYDELVDGLRGSDPIVGLGSQSQVPAHLQNLQAATMRVQGSPDHGRDQREQGRKRRAGQSPSAEAVKARRKAR
ncbi:hypothetical protein ACJX0J_042601, partial [Zea mays]